MKIFFTISFLIISLFCFAQQPFYPQSIGGSPKVKSTVKGAFRADSSIAIISFPDTATANKGNQIKFEDGILIKVGIQQYMRDIATAHWVLQSGGSGGSPVPSGVITTVPVLGTSIPINISSADWITAAFYGAQPPTATLSGGTTLEYSIGGAVTRSLAWTSSRQSATTNLTSIVVGGISQSFSNPSAPGTVGSSQNVSVPINVTTTYNNVTTASNGMSVTVSTTYNYRSKYYIGYVTTSTPTDADIIAATNGSVGGVFATNYIAAGTLSTPSSSKYYMFAFPASFGLPTIKVNGLTVIIPLTVRSFVNASGYSTSYNIYISIFPTSGSIEYQVL